MVDFADYDQVRHKSIFTEFEFSRAIMELFDTHAHLSYSPLIEVVDQVVAKAGENGVTRIAAIGTDLKSSLTCVELAERFEGVFASVGIHPTSGHHATVGQWQEITALLDHPKVIALGETGLDCYWDDCPLDIQQQWFATHIRTSHKSGKPLVVHLRESESEIIEAFEQQHDGGRINGIMHSYAGSVEAAHRFLEYGMYISFAGMVTFKNAQAIRNVASQVPLDRMLVETDSPYLTPHPHRGKKPNTPEMVVHTASCLANLLDIAPEEFARQTTENALRVFQLESD